jgi:hypothetical protein
VFLDAVKMKNSRYFVFIGCCKNALKDSIVLDTVKMQNFQKFTFY